MYFKYLQHIIPWRLKCYRICLQCGRSGFVPWVKRIPLRRAWLHTLVFLPGEFHGQRCLEGYSPWECKQSDTTVYVLLMIWALQAISHLVINTLCRNHLFPFSKWVTYKFGEGNGKPLQYSCLENPLHGEPGRLQSMGSLQVGHDWATSLSLFTFTQWRRQWQPTPVFLPGESQGWQSLVGCRLWGCTESDATEAT